MKALVIIDNKRIKCDVKKINIVDCELESIEVQPDKSKKGWLYVTIDRIIEFDISKNDYKKIVKYWKEEEKVDFLENGLLNNFQQEVDEIMLAEMFNIENSEEDKNNQDASSVAYDIVTRRIEEILK